MEVKMPAKITFDALPDIISLEKNITLKVKNFPTNAQAIIWQLKDIDGNFIQKETLTNELTLTSAELSQLIPGRNSLIKVAAYSLDKWDNGGKRFVFINEMVETANLELK
jgi:NifB/MoaA-like Fe-S oxidoreductase